MNEVTIWKFLKSEGLSDCGAAGLMGNLYAESALNPKNMQNSYEKKLGFTDETYTEAVDNGTYTDFISDRVGYGLWQLTHPSRKEGYLTYVKSKGKSIGDLATQLEYLMIELSKYKLLEQLKGAVSVSEASDLILLQFEKPASINNPDTKAKTMATRAGYAQNFYDEFAVQTRKGGSLMKYSESNKPMVCMQTQSTCYKSTRKMDVKGVLWHSTGTNNPYIKRYVQPSDDAADREYWLSLLGKNRYGNDWNHVQLQKGVNFWVGKLDDGTVTTVQTMPWNYQPWGCGSGKNGSCNAGWIQFEINNIVSV